MWAVKFLGFDLVWEKAVFLGFFQYFTLESLPRKSKHMFFERFLMSISWKKVPPRKFTKVHESSRKFTKVHESSNKNATKSTICRSTFSQIWMKPAVAQGNSHFFFEFAGNELNSFIFIEIARFQSILYFFMDFKPKYHRIFGQVLSWQVAGKSLSSRISAKRGSPRQIAVDFNRLSQICDQLCYLLLQA